MSGCGLSGKPTRALALFSLARSDGYAARTESEPRTKLPADDNVDGSEAAGGVSSRKPCEVEGGKAMIAVPPLPAGAD
jgi:hypothetical protein